jgi:hypothetical protein
MRNASKWGAAILAVVMISGCERGPVEPSISLDGQPDPAAVSAVQDSWDLLPSEEEIQLTALAVAQESAADPVTEALLFEAGVYEADAVVAADAGESDVAAAMVSWSSDAYLEAALNVLGAELATQVVEDVDLAVATVETAVGGDSPSLDVSDALDQARALADRARSSLSQGDRISAVRDALSAADAIREVSPQDRAKHFVAMAVRLLQKAKELAGPDPRPAIAEILRRAEARCDAAVRVIESGHWALAVREARSCASLSRRVIALLSGGIPDDRLEYHAIAVVDHADDLLQRAIALAGDDPQPEVAQALDTAEGYLLRAKEALANEHWREVIGLGYQSAALSKRVIGFFTHDRPSDGLQARAEQAVQHAKNLLAQADELVGDDSRPEVQGHLAKARELISQADNALQEEHWRRAIAKAHEAARVLYHLIRILS